MTLTPMQVFDQAIKEVKRQLEEASLSDEYLEILPDMIRLFERARGAHYFMMSGDPTWRGKHGWQDDVLELARLIIGKKEEND